MEASSLISIHGTTWICSAGPVHCTMVTAIDAVVPEPIASQQPRVAEGRHVALLLQLEAVLADAARGIDGQHQLQVDRLRRGWLPHVRREQDRQRENCRPQRLHHPDHAMPHGSLCRAAPDFARRSEEKSASLPKAGCPASGRNAWD